MSELPTGAGPATATVIITTPRDKRGTGYEVLREQPPPMPTGEAQPTQSEWHRHRLLGAGANLAKVILGVAILALPRIFSGLGIGTATIWLLFIALLTNLSLDLLTKASARSGLLSYSETIHHELGTFAQVIADLAVVVNGFGMMCIYLIVIGDALVGSSGADGLLSEACGSRAAVLAVVCLLLLLPLVLPRRFSAAASASMLGVGAILLWAVITLCLFFISWSNGQLHSMAWWPHGKFKGHGFESAVQMVGVLPVILLSYLSQSSFQHTLRDLSYVHERQIRNTVVVALSLATMVYLVIAIGSYGLFGKAEIQADVLNNFTVGFIVDALELFAPPAVAHAAFMAVRLGFVISLIAAFPLHMGPFRDSLWMLLFRQELIGPGYYLVTAATLAAAYFCGSYITNIWWPLMVLGSSAGVLIAFIFPGLLGMAMHEELTESAGTARSRRLAGAFLTLVGIVIGITGIARLIFYRDPLAD